MNHGSCSNCSFFDLHFGVQGGAAKATDGLCRYNPPVTQPGPTEHGLWPVVSAGDWCGHFVGGNQQQVAAE